MAAGFLRIVRIALILGGTALAQQLAQPAASQQTTGAPTAAPPSDPQAIAKSGLLPIYGVELGIDKTWIDGEKFPSQSKNYANSGVNASFQQVWDALKPTGFNFVRVGIDVYDLPASANRAANLCNWAKTNNVKLLLVLRGTSQGGSSDYVSAAASFVKNQAALLKQDAYKASYAQIAAYELEPDLNNPSVAKQVSGQANAQDLLIQTAQKIRTTETEALQGSGIEATPLVVRASFDYELISGKAIAGTTLTTDAYSTAYSSLVQWLKPLAASPNIDLISVDWFPGSISAGGVEKPPAFLRSLAADVPGKQMLFTTGFSTAFHSGDEQKQYYTMSFANLGDLRASGGPSSPFLGVIFREASNAKPPPAPNAALPQAVSKWDWQAKAGELATMWTDQKKSDDMNWWLESVQRNMGLLEAQSDAFNAAALKPKPALQALNQISSAVSTVSASTAAGGMGTVGQKGAGGIGSTLGQALQSKAEQGLSGLLDNVMQKLGNMAQSGFSGGGGGGGGYSAFAGGTSGLGQNAGLGFGQGTGVNAGAPCATNPTTPGPTDASATMTGNVTPMTSPAVPCIPNFPGSSFTGQTDSSALGAAMSGAVVPPAPLALPTGGITLTKQDVTLQPASPKVGQPVQITAKLHNHSSSPAAGVTILASGAKNAVLAQADSLQLPPNGVYPASLQWTPKDASPTSIVIKVSDGTGTEMASVALDPVTVAPAAAAGTGAKVRTPAGSDTGGSTASPNSTADSSSLSSAIPLGFAKIGDLVTENLVAGAGGSIIVPISNPLLVPLNNINAALMVDGKRVHIQTVSTLVPQQSKSIVFSNVVIAQPGSHEAKVVIQLQRGDPGDPKGAAKAQMGSVSQSIFVQPARALTAAALRKPGAAAPLVKASPALRSLVPTQSTAGSTSTNAAAGSGSPTTAGPTKRNAELTLRAADLTYSPMPATPGQTVAFRVVVHNSGGVPVQAASLVLSLYADGKLVASQPIQFSVGANSSYQASWQTSMPAGQQVQLVASATGDGSHDSASSKASIMLRSAITRKAAGTAKHP